MVILITILHVLICVFLIIVVLLQSGKAADLAGAFGGMGSQTVFGPRGSATVLSKATTIAATLFMITSLTLSIIATRQGAAVPAVFEKATKPNNQKQAPKQVPASAPITVTPSTDNGTGQTRQLNVPVQQVPAGQTPTLPAPPPAQNAPAAPNQGK